MTDFTEHLDRLAHECKAAAENLESGVADVDDVEDLAGLLVMAQEATRAARAAEKAVEARLIECMPTRELEVTGVGVVKKSRRTKYRGHDHDEIKRWVAKQSAEDRQVDPVTGEIEHADTAYLRWLEDVARLAWREGTLKGLGMQLDEFMEVVPDGWSVRIT